MLGHVEGVGKAEFQVISKRRGRGLERDSEAPEFDPKDYEFSFGPDKDLEYWNNVGQIVSVTDSGNDSDEE